MAAFQHILFPVDFSDRSKALCPLVKAMAAQFKAKLTLMNVVGMPIDTFGGVDRSFPVVFDFPALEPVIKERLSAYIDVAGAEIVVAMGDPASEIEIGRAHV